VKKRICEKCNVELKNIELKDVYQCPKCKMIVSERLKKPEDRD
tara:strand:+ start:102 stop:230 length:129 start_codon:yes stop_codon:yes gene_type:complete